MSGNEEDVSLAGYDDAYASAPEVENDFKPIPDGKYFGYIEEIKLGRVKPFNSQTKQPNPNAGTPLLTYRIKITGPEYTGRVHFKNVMITNDPEKIKWIKNDFFILGLKLAKISELPLHMKELEGVQLEFQLKTAGEFVNCYFNRLIAGKVDVKKKAQQDESIPL